MINFFALLSPSNRKLYVNEEYKVSFLYPSNWELKTGYLSPRYEGPNGFFQIGAIEETDLDINEVARMDAFHPTNPYGSQPSITSIKINNKEARLIKPSNDQDPSMQNMAGLIIKYSKPISINDSIYDFFMLWADTNHMKNLYQTLKFLD